MLAAARHYREYLASTAPVIEDEGRQLVAYDEIERLDRIIPSLECQLDEEQHILGLRFQYVDLRGRAIENGDGALSFFLVAVYRATDWLGSGERSCGCRG